MLDVLDACESVIPDRVPCLTVCFSFVYFLIVYTQQLMNSVFVGYEELSRSRRVFSAEVDNTLRDLLNSF